MRLAHKLLLLSTAVLAAAALNATTASATGPVEVHDELGNHCNPCVIDLVGESQITFTSGNPMSTCEDELTAEVYEDGSGHVTDYHNDDNHNGLPCTVQNCYGVGEAAAESEWPLQIEESAPGQEALDLRFCFDVKTNPNGTGGHCDGHANIDDLGNHHYEISMVNQSCLGGARIVNADWEIQSSPIEIEHPIIPSEPHTPVVIHDETGNHCNPCLIELHGESQVANPAGTPLWACEDTIHAEIYEQGSGHIDELISQDHALTSCLIQNCNGIGEASSELEWPLEIEESGPSQGELQYRFCVDGQFNPNDTGQHCDARADIVEEGNHHYGVFLVDQPCANGLQIWNATWEIEGTPIEIEHPDA